MTVFKIPNSVSIFFSFWTRSNATGITYIKESNRVFACIVYIQHLLILSGIRTYIFAKFLRYIFFIIHHILFKLVHRSIPAYITCNNKQSTIYEPNIPRKYYAYTLCQHVDNCFEKGAKFHLIFRFLVLKMYGGATCL